MKHGQIRFAYRDGWNGRNNREAGMAILQPMPEVKVPVDSLLAFGEQWQANGGSLSRSLPFSSGQLGNVFDNAVGESIAVMLGDIPIVAPGQNDLLPSHPDCVEVGPVRIIGGIRPQNFDVGYRPDGVRFAFDSKTLNDTKSVGKNWQNMVNDLATEAATVHSRFPMAVVGFLVAIPSPCFTDTRKIQIAGRLEGLGKRERANDQDYLAEAMALISWDPYTGEIDQEFPDPDSSLRIEKFHESIEEAYLDRYNGLPPH